MDTAGQEHTRAQTQTAWVDEDFDIEFVDLPRTEQNSRGPLARSRIWQKVLAWQRSIPSRARRRLGASAIVLMAVVALAVILGSINNSQATSSSFSPSSTNGALASQHSPANGASLANVAYYQHPLRVYGGQSDQVISVAWSPDGSRLAAGGLDGTVQIWNGRSGRLLLTYRGHHSFILGLAWSPDGTRIASASDDSTAQVWDARSGKLLFLYRSPSPTEAIESVAWSPDGSRIVIGEGIGIADGMARVWNVRAHKLLLTYHTSAFRPVLHVAWSPDGSRIASSSGTVVEVWNAATGQHILTYDGHVGLISDVAWSPDGKDIASSSLDTTIQVWNALSGKRLFTYFGHNDLVNGLAWSPDGTTIASGSADGTIQVWNAFLGQHIVTYLTQAQVNCIAWSPRGPLVAAGGSDGLVTLWLVA